MVKFHVFKQVTRDLFTGESHPALVAIIPGTLKAARVWVKYGIPTHMGEFQRVKFSGKRGYVYHTTIGAVYWFKPIKD